MSELNRRLFVSFVLLAVLIGAQAIIGMMNVHSEANRVITQCGKAG